MRTIVIEDEAPILEILKEVGAECYDNAFDALAVIQNEEVSLVYVDVHGIQRNNVNASTIIEACKEKGIEYVVTSTDPFSVEELLGKHGYFKTCTKYDVMVAAQKARVTA